MAILTIHHYLGMVESFIKNVTDSRESYYMFVGRPNPWLDENGVPDDTAVIPVTDSVSQHESTIYDDIVFGKIITENDVAQLAPRYNWANNTVYDVYDQNDGDLYDKQFYVVTDNREVYKCVDNNYGAPSTVKPALTTTSGTFKTSDGYTWKYMYTIEINKNSKFTTNNFIAVTPNTNVQENAVGGTIDIIRLTDGGSNYETHYSGYLKTVVKDANNIFNAYVVGIDANANPLNNYYTGSSMYLNSGFGSGQVRKIKSYDGLNRLVTLDTPFYTYMNFYIQDVNGTFNVGDQLTQNIDSLAVLFSNGYFQQGDSVIQTDTGANGLITSANSSIFRVLRNSSNSFSVNYPIFNTSYSGILANGTVEVVPFTVLNVTSNTGAFTIGETIYQSNGSANTANGVVFSANSSAIRLALVNGVFSNSYQVAGANSLSNAVISNTTTDAAGLSYAYATPGSLTNLDVEYSLNGYIRIGTNANTNLRRITAVNSSVITLSLPLSSNAVSQQHFRIENATTVDSISLISASGYITNSNLNGVKLTISNSEVAGVNFIIGEKVNMVDSANVNQSVYGIVSYANTENLIITNISGSFIGGNTFYIRGDSSIQRALINTIDTYKNVTINQPTGNFYVGQPIKSKSSLTGLEVGSANVISISVIPNELTHYYISPTVTITGDGVDATAYSVINTDVGTTNNISQIVMINPGRRYTQANVAITANTFYGSGATAEAVISPALGHGSNTYAELGARYAGISVLFDRGINENYKFPVYGKYRRLGIIENVLFNDVTVNLNAFDRVRLNLTNKSGGGFQTDEIVYQANSKTAGVVVFANSSFIELKNVRGAFAANSKFANNFTANDNIIGLTSNTTANVATANVIYFSLLSNAEIIRQSNTMATGKIVSVNSNTQLLLTGVTGDFAANDVIYDPVTNAYANVTSIYVANGTQEVTYSFADKFTQTLRIPLTTNTAAFEQFEYVRQNVTNAYGKVISDGNSDIDIQITGLIGGTFSVGNVIQSQNTFANAVVSFANSSYLRLTAADGDFYSGDIIINNLSVSATVANVFPALVLNDLSSENQFQSGVLSSNIVGQSSGAIGKCIEDDVILYPDLVRDSGTVIYMENLEPFELSNTSKETIKLVIKF